MTAANRRRGQLRRSATPDKAARRMEVLRRFRAGERSGEIARTLGIAKSTVFVDLERIAPELLAEYRAKLAAEAEEKRRRNALIRRARGQGHTLKRIAAAAGVTYQRIQAVTRVESLPDTPDTREPGREQDVPLDRPKRKCSNCGRTFQPTVTRRMLCAYCYRRGDPDGEE